MYQDVENGFSILIPTYNNIGYLKLCVKSIRNNTILPYEILVHVNEGNDGTIDWLEESDIRYTHSDSNIGLSAGLNRIRQLATKKLTVFLNDDMYMLPGWDTAFKDYLLEHKCGNNVWLCGTIIEPTNNARYVIAKDYGTTPQNFDEARILKDLPKLQQGKDTPGARVCPILMHVDIWDEIGGYSEEFPGATSDADIVAKMYHNGCRHFLGLRKALGYHFSSKTRSRFSEPMSKQARFKKFKEKYGVTPPEFFNTVVKQETLQ